MNGHPSSHGGQTQHLHPVNLPKSPSNQIVSIKFCPVAEILVRAYFVRISEIEIMSKANRKIFVNRMYVHHPSSFCVKDISIFVLQNY